MLYAHNPYIICAVHPSGVESDSCIDFKEDPSAEELWQPDGASYYNGELILQPSQLTTDQQLEALSTHPMFTGSCPQCGAFFNRDYILRVHWDCHQCGWKDDSI
ncbi:hypothetical protein ACSQ6I_27375 [Anabaena sp. WFMT]|uniref:hypothetical protein n=1 Tax=Anabaena sp. WFMT TaxID=3449730 RepID=UPI003F24C947